MKSRIVAAILIAVMAGSALAQTSSKKKGMAWGVGLGAIAGGVIGGHGSDALIGAAVGTGIGYLVGNEQDKKKAQEMSAQSPKGTHSETGPFAGTTWRLQDWSPKSGKEVFKSKTFSFGKDGWITTSTTNKDGRKTTDRENYRVVDNTLIVNKGDYLLNFKFVIQGDQLTVDAEKVRAILKRI
jgi:uncharacterized protein YcfJ